MKSNKTDEYNALIRLLDEPDEEMFASIRTVIISEGKAITDHLKEHALFCLDDKVIERITDILTVIHFNYISTELKRWHKLNGANLFQGICLLAQYRYPELDIDKIKKTLHDIEQDIWLEMNDSLSYLEKIRVFNHVFFDMYGFKPNKTDFYNPSNSYINDVIKHKTGNPILLSVIYMIVAQHIGLPVYGVNLPEHFVCVLINEGTSSLEIIQQGEPLFYINPYHYGSIFSKKEIKAYLNKLNHTDMPEYYQVCNHIDIVKRILNNLSYSYKQNLDIQRYDDIEKIKSILD